MLFIILISAVTTLRGQEIAMLASTKALETTYSSAITWTEGKTFDFGKIVQNQPVSRIFKFKNTSDTPLLVLKAQGSCGCTVTEYSSDMIAPGEVGFVKATFNAAKAGAFHKTVTVTTNLEDEQIKLEIFGEVVTD